MASLLSLVSYQLSLAATFLQFDEAFPLRTCSIEWIKGVASTDHTVPGCCCAITESTAEGPMVHFSFQTICGEARVRQYHPAEANRVHPPFRDHALSYVREILL